MYAHLSDQINEHIIKQAKSKQHANKLGFWNTLLTQYCFGSKISIKSSHEQIEGLA